MIRWLRSLFQDYQEIQRLKRCGLCPVCRHGMHRDGPCAACGVRCRYPATIDAAQDRFNDALAEFRRSFRQGWR